MALRLKGAIFFGQPCIIVFSGLSPQESVQERSQKLEFGATLKRKVQSHGRYVSADANFSERSPRSLK